MNLKSYFSSNSIAQKTNKILDKILPSEARAEFCQIFFFAFWEMEFQEKYRSQFEYVVSMTHMFRWCNVMKKSINVVEVIKFTMCQYLVLTMHKMIRAPKYLYMNI